MDERKIAVYARKSKITESGKSVENQISKCKSYADLKFDAKDEDILIYQDEGLSGYYSDRPAYTRMLRDIRDNKIKAVICYKFDRISRRTVDLLNLVERLKTKKISFVSCTDEVDTGSKTGRIVMSLLASIAEFERDIIAERIADNMYELAKDGRWLGGVTPTGFRSKKEYSAKGGGRISTCHLEAVFEEMEVVREIFVRFLECRSLGGVVSWARDRDIRTKTGRPHTRASVRGILTNPVYAAADEDTYAWLKAMGVPIYATQSDFDGTRGLMAYNKTEQTKEPRDDYGGLGPSYAAHTARREIDRWIVSVGRHEAVTPGKKWIQTQEIIQENRDKHKRPNERTQSLLSGIIICPVCGKNLYTHRESGRYTQGMPRFLYKCQTRRANKSDCSYTAVKGNEADRLILDAICRFGGEDDARFKSQMRDEAVRSEKNGGKERESRLLERRICRVSQGIEGQTKNLRSAPESVKPALMEDLAKLAEELASLERQRKELSEERQRPSDVPDIENARGITTSFFELAETLSYQEKLELVRTALQKVVILRRQDGEVAHIFLKGAEVGAPAEFF